MFFTHPQVVIVDDEISEAQPIVDALRDMGIPAIWYSGTGPEGVPENPLQHIRLLVLDLQLGTPGFDPKDTAGKVLRILAPTAKAGPCIILAWTKHSDKANDFAEALKKYTEEKPLQERVLPLAIVSLGKDEFKESNGELIARVKQELESNRPFYNLLEWESSNSLSASTMVQRLSALALRGRGDRDIERRNRRMKDILNKLVMVQTGQECPEDNSAEFRQSLFSTLNLIHDSGLGSSSPNSCLQPEQLSWEELDDETTRAVLNSIILTEGERSPYTPGAIILANDINIDGLPFGRTMQDATSKNFLSNIFKKQTIDHEYNKITQECALIIAEISPACDVAQKNRKRLRILPGVIVPESMRASLKDGENLKNYKPLYYNNKVCRLVLDCHYFISLPLDAQLPQPIFRLRSHVISDLLSWVGGELSRPGHLSLQS